MMMNDPLVMDRKSPSYGKMRKGMGQQFSQNFDLIQRLQTFHIGHENKLHIMRHKLISTAYGPRDVEGAMNEPVTVLCVGQNCAAGDFRRFDNPDIVFAAWGIFGPHLHCLG